MSLIPFLLSAPYQQLRFLSGLWMWLSKWKEKVLPFSSDRFSSTSELFSSKESCWEGVWSVGCSMEGLWGCRSSMPDSIWSSKGRPFSQRGSEWDLSIGGMNRPFIRTSGGRGLFLLADWISLLVRLGALFLLEHLIQDNKVNLCLQFRQFHSVQYFSNLESSLSNFSFRLVLGWKWSW